MKKTNMNRRNGKKIIALLIMLSVVLSSGTFAYWANYVEGTSDEVLGTIEIGTGEVVETQFNLSNNLNSGGYLVPTGQSSVENVGTVEAIDLSFDLAWNEDEETTKLLGVDSVGQVVIDHEIIIELNGVVLDATTYANIYDLVNVAYNNANATELTLDAAAQTFAFQITLDEPADQAEYNSIASADIFVTFSYSIDTSDIVTTDLN